MKKILAKLIFGIFLFSTPFLSVTAQNQLTEKSSHSVQTTTITNPDRDMTPRVNYLNEQFDSGIPSSWTITDGNSDGITWEGITNLEGNTLNGTPFIICNSLDNPFKLFDDYIESPSFNSLSATTLNLSFEQYFLKQTGNDTCYVDIYNGTTWINVYKHYGAHIGEWSAPDVQNIDILAYKNADMKVRFHYKAIQSYQRYWAIDNVVVSEPSANDVGVFSIDCGNSSVGTITPKAMVKNYGTAAQTFDVTMEITPGTYTSTKTITSLSPNTTSLVVFDNWNATVGSYSAKAYTQLTGDAEHDNDTLSSSFVISDLSHKAFGYIAYTNSASLSQGPIKFDLDNPSFIVQINYDEDEALTGGAWANNKWYGVVLRSELVTMDTTTGAKTTIGEMEVLDINGISYDPTTETMFGVSDSALYSINMLTGKATFINNCGLSPHPIFVNLACNPINGNLYTLDLISENLYKIDKTNGSVTEIGNIGVNVNQSQDAEFGPDGTLYLALYVPLDIPSSILGICDTQSANLISQKSFGNGLENIEISGFAIPPTHATAINENEVRTSIFPNPAHDFVVIDASTEMSLIEVLNINGQVVASQQVNSNHQVLNLKSLSSGTYIIHIKTAKGIVSKKLQIL